MPSLTHIDSFPGDVEVSGSLITGDGVDSVNLEEGSGSTYKRLLIADATSGALQFKTHGSVKYSPQYQYLDGESQAAVHAVNAAHAQGCQVCQGSTNASHSQLAAQAQHAPYANSSHHAGFATHANFAFSNCYVRRLFGVCYLR